MATATDRLATVIDDDPAPPGDVLFEVIHGVIVECPPMGSGDEGVE